MAEFKSDTYQAQETAQSNAGKIIADAALISGKGQCPQFEVTVPAGTAADDTILLGFIPVGAVIIPGKCTVTTPLAAGSGPVKIGFADDDDAIASAVDVNTVGSRLLNSVVPNYKVSKRQPLVLTLTGGLGAGRKIYFNIDYNFAE